MFRPLKSNEKQNSKLSKSRLQTENKPASSTSRRKSLSNINPKMDRSSSPLYKSTIIDTKLNKSTLSNPSRVLQPTKSNLSLNKGLTKVNSTSRFKSPTIAVKPVTSPRVMTKTSQPAKSLGRSMIKSDIMSRIKINSPMTKSALVKPKSTTATKPSLPTFGKKPLTKPNTKPISKMKTIKQQNTQVLYPLQIEELQNKVKQLSIQLSRVNLQVFNVKDKLTQRTKEYEILQQQFYHGQAEKMIRSLNNRILLQAEKETYIKLQALTRMSHLNQQKIKKLQQECKNKDSQIFNLSTNLNDYQSQLEQITSHLKQVEKQTSQLFNQKSVLKKVTQQFEQNKSFMNQSILMKNQQVSQLKNSLVNVTKTWQNKYKYLQDELEHSKQQYLKKQRDLQTTRMILQQQRGKSFQANQQLMTMITQTDSKNQQQIQVLRTRCLDLQQHIKSYEQIFEKMQRDMQYDQKKKQQYENTRDRQMDSLQDMLSKIQQQGMQFLKAREKQIKKRESKRLYPYKSSIK